MTTSSYDEDIREVPAEAALTDAEEQVERRGFDLKGWLLRPRTLISFGLALGIILFIFRGIDIDPAETIRQMRQVNPALYLLAFVIFYLTFPLRAVRWHVLLRNAGF